MYFHHNTSTAFYLAKCLRCFGLRKTQVTISKEASEMFHFFFRREWRELSSAEGRSCTISSLWLHTSLTWRLHYDLHHFSQTEELLLRRGTLIQLAQFPLGTWYVEAGKQGCQKEKKNGTVLRRSNSNSRLRRQSSSEFAPSLL